MNAYIFHGTGGSPTENWFLWLKDQLEKRGINTLVPELLNSSNPNKNTWLTQAQGFKTSSDTILIGHSLGAVLILRMLEAGHTAKAVYLIAPFLHDLDWKVLKESLFFSDSFDWNLIKKQCSHFEVFTSKNDPYLSLEDVAEVADKLNVQNQVLDVKKHFNIKEFPYLLERIKNI